MSAPTPAPATNPPALTPAVPDTATPATDSGADGRSTASGGSAGSAGPGPGAGSAGEPAAPAPVSDPGPLPAEDASTQADDGSAAAGSIVDDRPTGDSTAEWSVLPIALAGGAAAGLVGGLVLFAATRRPRDPEPVAPETALIVEQLDHEELLAEVIAPRMGRRVRTADDRPAWLRRLDPESARGFMLDDSDPDAAESD